MSLDLDNKSRDEIVEFLLQIQDDTPPEDIDAALDRLDELAPPLKKLSSPRSLTLRRLRRASLAIAAIGLTALLCALAAIPAFFSFESNTKDFVVRASQSPQETTATLVEYDSLEEALRAANLPMISFPLPARFSFSWASADALSGFSSCVAYYSSSDGGMTFRAIRYDDPDTVMAKFEAEDTGYIYDSCGAVYYITQNTTNYRAVWNKGATLFSIVAPISEEELKEILDSIKY